MIKKTTLSVKESNCVEKCYSHWQSRFMKTLTIFIEPRPFLNLWWSQFGRFLNVYIP